MRRPEPAAAGCLEDQASHRAPTRNFAFAQQVRFASPTRIRPGVAGIAATHHVPRAGFFIALDGQEQSGMRPRRLGRQFQALPQPAPEAGPGPPLSTRSSRCLTRSRAPTASAISACVPQTPDGIGRGGQPVSIRAAHRFRHCGRTRPRSVSRPALKTLPARLRSGRSYKVDAPSAGYPVPGTAWARQP